MSDFIEVLAPDTLDRLQKANSEILKMISNVSKLNGNVLGAKSPVASDDAVKKLTAAYNEQEKTIQRLQKQIEKLAQTRANNSKLSVQERIDNEILNRAAREQAKFNSILTSEYEKMSITLNRLRNEAKSIAIVFGEDSVQFANASRNVKDLDDKLKRIDRTLGQSQRNVGNYIGGFLGIGNSVNQIARELPAAAYGFQTFAVAIGNNVPILIDSINEATAANKQLAASGQATVPIWTQVKNALFSFNTALTIGLLVLALYGKEIGEFVKGLFSMSDAFESVTKSQEAFNKARVEGQKAIVSDTLSLRSYLQIAKDDKLSMEERQIALNKLRSEYPFYFKNLTDQEILAGKAAKAEQEITKALNAKGEAEKANDQTIINKQKILELTDKQEKLEQLIPKKRQERDNLRLRSERALGREEASALSSLAVTANRELIKLETRRKLNQKEIGLLLQENAKHEADILRLQKESIGLQYSPDKDNSLEEYMRYVESLNRDAYELNKFRMEQEILALEKLATDEKRSFADRIESYGEMLKKRQELLRYSLDFETKEIEASRQKEVFDENKSYEKNREKYKDSREDLLKIERDHKAQLDFINKSYYSKQQLAVEKYNADYLKVVEDTSKAELEIIHKRNEAIESTEKTYRDEQSAIFKKTADNEKLSLEIRQKSFESYIMLRRKQIDIDRQAAIARAIANNEEVDAVKAQFEVIQRQLTDESLNNSPFNKALEKANDQLKQLRKTVTSDFFGEAGLSSLTQFFDGTYKAVIDGFDKMASEVAKRGGSLEEILAAQSEATRKKFEYTFQAVAEVAQQVISQISQLQQQSLEAQLSRLDKQKEVAIKFAGDSVEAREEIERQYDERRREIQIRQAKAQKELAIFNAIINTAQGVTAALAEANYALAIVIGVLGAAQIALIAAQPIPEFWKGTKDAPEGLAWTQEKGAEIITDKQGNVKTTGSSKGRQLTKLEKGDKVYTAHETKRMLADYSAFNHDLNAIMQSNNIGSSPVIVNNEGASAEDIERAFENVMGDRPILMTKFDSEGFSAYLQKRGQRTNYMKKRLSGRGDSV